MFYSYKTTFHHPSVWASRFYELALCAFNTWYILRRFTEAWLPCGFIPIYHHHTPHFGVLVQVGMFERICSRKSVALRLQRSLTFVYLMGGGIWAWDWLLQPIRHNARIVLYANSPEVYRQPGHFTTSEKAAMLRQFKDFSRFDPVSYLTAGCPLIGWQIWCGLLRRGIPFVCYAEGSNASKTEPKETCMGII